MIAVIFEVEVKPEYLNSYLDVAATLKAELEQIDGFISVERFQSLTHEGKLLSLSFFRDEEAVREWRNLPSHRDAQKKGRHTYFKDYRLRVTEVLRDYGMSERNETPEDSVKQNG
ncbi:antibiotic biosynthesis monooxygenase [Sneathiella sp. P13V-1]|uniref:antibiotic biosynthesis monooxygenase family protein n=1 Tax=Sneathiella sp. P13V-1 TaxID=2697366 RepID=UPI00187B5243|nr:antibiotic biosynthesis monooxygenase [Sneathiella sp. P13V-1]MBE7637439.1 antibiotic biosynthesis monooxygenase [Sneathiella sp. P13V-1]